MPHRSHHRRHRSGHRRGTAIMQVALGVTVTVGVLALGAVLIRTPAGAAAVIATVAICALVALAFLSLAAGRIAAAVRNGLSLYSAHSDLGRFMRRNPTFRAARDSVLRPRN